MLHLKESDVERLLNFSSAIQVVEEAFRQFGLGQVVNVPRKRAVAAPTVLHSMSAVATYLGFAAWKCYVTVGSKAVFHVGLSDAQTGELVALIEADRLGQMRTAAATAVAVRHLTPATLDQMALFGTGWQAQSQLEAVAQIRNFKQVQVYSRNAERRTEFAQFWSQKLGIDIVPAESPEAAVKDQPLIITATASRTPVFSGELISPDQPRLIAAIGSNWPQKAEVDALAVHKMHRVFCDSIVACQEEAGDLLQAAEQGSFDWSLAEELSEVVSGKIEVDLQQGPVLFKSVGLAIEDVAVAAHIFQRYVQQQVV